MYYTAALFADDSLIAGELITRMETIFPKLSVNVYAPEGVDIDLGAFEQKPLGEFGPEEILIVLCEPVGEALDRFSSFDGSVIDLSGRLSLIEDVYNVFEPVQYIIGRINKDDRKDAYVTAHLPAAFFGKDGVDGLIGQTRSIFSFGSHEEGVFGGRLAFNMIMAEGEGRNGRPEAFAALTRELTGANLDIRIMPVSTAFLVDVYLPGSASVDFSGYFEAIDRPATVEEAAGLDVIGIIGEAKPPKMTFAGDYVRFINTQILMFLKEILGEEE